MASAYLVALKFLVLLRKPVSTVFVSRQAVPTWVALRLEVCVDDQCVADPCAGVNCRPAEVCLRGECIADPCVGVACPNHQKCVVTDGTAQCVGDWPINEPDPSTMMSGDGQDDAPAGEGAGNLSPNSELDGEGDSVNSVAAGGAASESSGGWRECPGRCGTRCEWIR